MFATLCAETLPSHHSKKSFKSDDISLKSKRKSNHGVSVAHPQLVKSSCASNLVRHRRPLDSLAPRVVEVRDLGLLPLPPGDFVADSHEPRVDRAGHAILLLDV